MAKSPIQTITAGKRLFVVGVVGILAAVAVAAAGKAVYAPLVGWATAGMLYVAWTLITVLGFNATETRSHARRENPGRALADVVLIFASIASLAAVGFLVFRAGSSTGIDKAFDIGLGLLSVIVSWGVVHTSYLLKYARLYYSDPEGGIDFNDSSAPKYSDFAYLAFTVGMTFQVSDTDIKNKQIRATILKHALLSFLFGTVIIATTINTLASLSQ